MLDSRRLTTCRGLCALAVLLLAAALSSIGSPSPASALGTVVYVDVDAAGTADGTSWANAFVSVQEAIDNASDGDQIWVASGLYSDCHVVDVDIELYGGFDPVTAPDLGTRDPDVHSTGLTGPNICVASVDVLDGVDATLSGFQVNDGTQAIQTGDGAVTLHRISMTRAEQKGIAAFGTDLTIRDVSVANSGLLVDSRAVEVHDGNVDIDGLEITDVFGSGAIFFQTGGVMRDISVITTTLDCIEFQPAQAFVPSVTMVVVDLHTAGCGEDGVVIGQSLSAPELNVDVTILNSTIGSATSRSVVISHGSQGRIENSVIRASVGAEFDAYSPVGPPGSSGDFFVVGSTVVGSFGTELIDPDGRLHFQNTIFDSPVAPDPSTTSSFRRSLVPGSGGSTAWSYGGTVDLGGNLDGDPLFVDAPVDLRVTSGSPAIDTGGNAALSFDVHDVDEDGDTSEHTPDLDFANRVRNGHVDIGAYELVSPPPGLTVLGGPCVVYDSDGAGESPFVGGETRTVQVTGRLSGQGGAVSCVPPDASSVVFRISSIDPLTEGNLLMTPAGVTATGLAGVVNYGAANGLNNANTVTVPVSAGGAVDIGANTGPAGAVPTTDVRLVAIGYYYSPDADPDLTFVPLNPCAVLDSRPSQGASGVWDGPAPHTGLWPVGSVLSDADVDVVGPFPVGQGGGNGATGCGVPETADAVLLNVVAVNMEGGSGHLSVGPGGADPVDEATTPFAVLSPKMNNGATTIVNLGPGGTVAIDIDGDPSASTMIRVEVLGYFDQDAAGLAFNDVTPCAVFDTRISQGADGVFAGERQHGPANTTTYQITGADIAVEQGGVVDDGRGLGTCGVPNSAQAVLINLEAVNALQEGNFWVSAAGTTTTGGVLNFNNVVPKMNNANAVVVPLSASGQLDLEINAGNFTASGTSVAHARGVVLGYFD